MDNIESIWATEHRIDYLLMSWEKLENQKAQIPTTSSRSWVEKKWRESIERRIVTIDDEINSIPNI